MHLSDEDPGFLGRETDRPSHYLPDGTEYACWAIGWTGKIVRDPETGRMHLPGWTGELHVEVAGPEYSDAAQNRMRAGLAELAGKLAYRVLGFSGLVDDQPPYALVVATAREFLETLQGTPLWGAAQDVISDAEEGLNALNQASSPDSGEDDDGEEEDSADKEQEVLEAEVVRTAASDGVGTGTPVSSSPQRSADGPDVVIGTNQATGAKVILPYASRPGHITLVGGTGTGKTTLLERLIRQDIENGTACIVFDVHGDMTENLLRFVSSRPERADRTLLVELDPTRADPAFGANLYECPRPDMTERTVNGVRRFLQRFWGEGVTGPIVDSGLTHTTRTIVANPGYTMAEVPYLYGDTALRAHLLQQIPDTGPGESVHQYWQEYDGLARGQDRDIWRRSIINKLEQFLANADTYPVLAQERSTIPWEEILTGGYCLLIRLPLAAGDRSTEYLNALLLNQLARHITARTAIPDPAARPRVHVYLDEYRRLASEETTALLDEARKANVGLTVAMQTLADLADEADREAVLQTATRIAFRTTHEVAAAVASGFAPPPKLILVKKGISQNPVDYLLQHTHSRREVRQLTQASLAPLISELEQAARNRSTSIPDLGYLQPTTRPLRSSFPSYPTIVSEIRDNTNRLSKARDELNRLLVDVMEGREQPGSTRVFTRMLDVFLERFGKLAPGIWAYIAIRAAQDLLPPGTSTAQAVAAHIGTSSRDHCAASLGQLSFGGESARLALETVKRSGITSEAVRAADEAAANRFRKRERERIEQEGGKSYPLPSTPRGFLISAQEVSEVADMGARDDPNYSKYLAPFEDAKFPTELFPREHVRKLIQETRHELERDDLETKISDSGRVLLPPPMATRQHRLAFLDQFGESAQVMACLWGFLNATVQIVEKPYFDDYAKCHDSEGLPRDLDSSFPHSGLGRDHDEALKQDYRRKFDSYRFPFVADVPLARILALTCDYVRSITYRGWQPVPTVESLKPDEKSAGSIDGWRLDAWQDPEVIWKYERLAGMVNDVKSHWSGSAAEADLGVRLLLHKARMAIHSQEYADHVLPNDFLWPPGQWPKAYSRLGDGRVIGGKEIIARIVWELRRRLISLRVEEQLWHARKYYFSQLYDDAQVNPSALTETQRATIAAYCRHQLLDRDADKDDETLRASYPQEFHFLADIHRICELLAQEPIEVSSGPQEERQQTTADVIDEVKRQLTQLGTGEAFCALLQEDHTLATAKVKLLPAEPIPAGDPAVIRQIRTRSWQRFSRSRAEIDEKTRARRAVGTRGTKQPPPPDQKPPPDTDPPIGRR